MSLGRPSPRSRYPHRLTHSQWAGTRRLTASAAQRLPCKGARVLHTRAALTAATSTRAETPLALSVSSLRNQGSADLRALCLARLPGLIHWAIDSFEHF